MNLPIEDEVGDVLSKAQKGLGINTETLAKESDLAESEARAARRGEAGSDAVYRAVAKAMGLNADAVARLARGDWHPETPAPIAGFKLISTPFHSWQVNAFLLWDPESKRAAAFDTGTEAKPMLDAIEAEGLALEAIILTHAHWDHCEAAPALLARWPEARIYLNAKENQVGGNPLPAAEGFEYALGRLSIRGFETPGHTAGGMTYVVDGLEQPIAVVGDALFAGSMGGANVSYEAGLQSVRKILALDERTVLAPGHGPLTTVREERAMNCFFVAEET